MALEERDGVCDEAVEVQVPGQLAQDDVQHVGLVDLEYLVAAVQDGLGEHVDAKDGLAGDEDVEETGDVVVGLDVVGVHGQGAGEGVEGLDAVKVAAELRVGVRDDVREELELRGGRPKGRQHEVSDSEDREAGDELGSQGRVQDQEEDLADVVVALEVA